MDISSLIAAGGPVVLFLGQILAISTFVYWLQRGLNLTIFMDMPPKMRKFWKRLASHISGPILTIILFGAKVLEMPRRGAWGYLAAAAFGWAGSIVAVIWHHRKKNRAVGKLPK